MFRLGVMRSLSALGDTGLCKTPAGADRATARIEAIDEVRFRELAVLFDDEEYRSLGRQALEAGADWIEVAAPPAVRHTLAERG